MGLRFDIEECDHFPDSWCAYGDILPLCDSAPVRQYRILRLPFFSRREVVPGISRPQQLALVWTATPGWPETPFDGWRFHWCDCAT